MTRMLYRNGFRHCNKPRLRRPIVLPFLLTIKCRPRGSEHNGATTIGNHMTHGFLGSEKSTIKIYTHDAVPFLRAHLGKTWRLTTNTCVHETRINTTAFIHRGIKTGTDLSLITNVALECQNSGSETNEFLSSRSVFL